ncbi:MAG TPA: Rieske 2Fe-2S domain-containing protein [Capsulimonadaceae bacterium]|jgi:nitrite reductase/ring-hydroxylating ferredoxin subunit
MTDIGPVEQFTELPAEVEIAGRPFFLVQQGEGHALLLRICPHAGGEVVDDGDELYCPHHYWRFDRASGCGIQPRDINLRVFGVTIENGRFVTEFAV